MASLIIPTLRTTSMNSRSEIRRPRHLQILACALFASAALATTAAFAQADGDLNAAIAPQFRAAVTDSQQARIAAVAAPGGALMNHLDARMRQIQATQDPALRQRRMDDFLKTLRSGMENISKAGAVTHR